MFFSNHVHAWPIPDTGQTKCYNNTGEITCPQVGEAFYGQDGNYLINPPPYTKLDASGNALPDTATSWAMIKDNVTGLIWENKTNDGSIHDGSKTFTWCDMNSAINGGNQGTYGTGTGAAATDTEAFVKALNNPNAARLFYEWFLSPQGLVTIDKVTGKGVAFPGAGTRHAKELQGLDLIFRTEEIIVKAADLGLVERFAKILGVTPAGD